MASTIEIPVQPVAGGLGFFERYLSLWVGLCMAAGILVGKVLPGLTAGLRGIEFGKGSQINAPIAVLIIKPFSMALLAWAFFRILFAPFIALAEADQ